jgi:hypothetical protein
MAVNPGACEYWLFLMSSSLFISNLTHHTLFFSTTTLYYFRHELHSGQVLHHLLRLELPRVHGFAG